MKKIILALAALAIAAGMSAQDLATATSTYNSGAEALTMGNKTDALEYFQKALSIAEGLGDEGADVVANCKNAIPSVILSIGKELYNNKDFEGALAKMKEASDKAVAAINRTLALTPNHPLVLNHNARILLVANGGEINDAVAQADLATLAALDADPENLTNRKDIYVQVLGRLGNYYITQKNIDEARKMFERFYSIQPSEELRTYIDGLK